MKKDLDYWKKKLLSVLKGDVVEKSIEDIPGSRLEKAKGYATGTIRTWSGKEFKKLSSGKWIRTFSGTGERGERQAVRNVMNKIQKASTMEELVSVVRDNRERFVDESGKVLPVVKEFLDSARTTLPGKKVKETEKKPEKAKDKKVQSIRDNYESGPSVTGDTDDIYVGKEEITGTWKLVESSAPTASHDEKTFNKTKDFPKGKDGSTINDRDYEKDKAAQLAVNSIASGFDGRALSFDSPVVVTQDGVVVSGNNRTMSSKIAARKGTDKKYIEALKKRSKKFGFSPEDIDKFKNPRVVFQVDSKEDYSTEQFAKFNETGTKAMSPIESAVKMSKIIHDDVVKDVADKIQEFDTLGELYSNKKASNDVFDSLQKGGIINEFTRPQYVTEEGITGAGKEFLETVMIGSVVNEANIRGLNREGAKSIRKKLVRAITPLVRNKGLGGYSVSDELNRAIDVSMQVKLQKDKFSSIEDFANQSSLFEAKDDVAIELAKKLDMKEKDFADFMGKMNANLEVGASGQADMFFGDVETKDQVLERMLKKALGVFNRLKKSRLVKAKYIKRWKGKDGKYKYLYKKTFSRTQKQVPEKDHDKKTTNENTKEKYIDLMSEWIDGKQVENIRNSVRNTDNTLDGVSKPKQDLAKADSNYSAMMIDKNLTSIKDKELFRGTENEAWLNVKAGDEIPTGMASFSRDKKNAVGFTGRVKIILRYTPPPKADGIDVDKMLTNKELAPEWKSRGKDFSDYMNEKEVAIRSKSLKVQGVSSEDMYDGHSYSTFKIIDVSVVPANLSKSIEPNSALMNELSNDFNNPLTKKKIKKSRIIIRRK